MIPDTPSSAASGMGLVEELRAWADRIAPLGWADVGRERILRAADALSAKDRELAEAREARQRSIDYSIDLQRIIEDLCGGRNIREPGTTARYHYDMATTAERARDDALSALREKEEALSKVQRTIGHRDRRITRLWAAIEDARAKGYRLPGEEEPPVVLSSAENLCPHAPTYDAGLCCGHPDDCTFVTTVSREQRGEEA